VGEGRHTEGRRPLQRAGRRDRERQVESCEGGGKGRMDAEVKGIIKIIIIIIIIIIILGCRNENRQNA